MASSQKTVDFITDQLSKLGDVRSRKMFGEYAIYCDDVVVALVCDDQLFVKITESGRKIITDPDEASPYSGAKPYFRIPEDEWDNREWLTKLFSLTRQALPIPKPKRPKITKGKK